MSDLPGTTLEQEDEFWLIPDEPPEPPEPPDMPPYPRREGPEEEPRTIVNIITYINPNGPHDYALALRTEGEDGGWICLNLRGDREDAKRLLAKIDELFDEHVTSPLFFETRVHPDGIDTDEPPRTIEVSIDPDT